MIIFDGQKYEDETQIPDMGSLVCIDVNGYIRNYEGLSKDVGKLPKYADLRTGSSFFAIDTSEAYKYEATTKTWYKLS